MNDASIFVLFFVVIILFALSVYSSEYLWNKFIYSLKSFFDLGLGLDNYPQYGAYKPQPPYTIQPFENKKKIPHVHTWLFSNTVKHQWNIVDSKPIGSCNPIDRVIEKMRELPGHTETQLETVLGWKNHCGYEVVHTSWNNWRCQFCGEIKRTEYYTAPSKIDRSAYLLTSRDLTGFGYNDIGNNKKKETAPLPTYRREIPVEKMKRYC